jgi:ankyrin repeat protein
VFVLPAANVLWYTRIDTQGNTALMKASEYDNAGCVLMLIEAKADLTIKSNKVCLSLVVWI